MKKTFKELTEIDVAVASLYKKNPELRESKFGLNYSRFYTLNYEPAINELKNQLKVVAIEHALEDEKTKAIVRDPQSPRGYAYSKQGEKDVNKGENDLIKKFNEELIEVKPCISKSVPDMDESTKELLTGILI